MCTTPNAVINITQSSENCFGAFSARLALEPGGEICVCKGQIGCWEPSLWASLCTKAVTSAWYRKHSCSNFLVLSLKNLVYSRDTSAVEKNWHIFCSLWGSWQFSTVFKPTIKWEKTSFRTVFCAFSLPGLVVNASRPSLSALNVSDGYVWVLCGYACFKNTAQSGIGNGFRMI